MLAKLSILVPFQLTVPLEGYPIHKHEYEEDSYKVIFEVPSASAKMATGYTETPDSLYLNGKPAIQADVVNITFRKESFNRRDGSEIDPPEATIQKCLDSLLIRLKYVTKSPQVHLIEFNKSQWRLRYLNDDQSELEQVEGLIRGRVTEKFQFSLVGCDPVIWNYILSLPENFQPPPWYTLLVDSRGSLPHVGTAIVLATTALEVLIAEILDRLANESMIPKELWLWINDRGYFQKDPSTEEQYDVLLSVLTGHSLKDDNTLWEGFKNLRKARNSFVHEGIARVGRDPITIDETMKLIGLADAIAARIREWLPDQHRWPIFDLSCQITLGKLFRLPPGVKLNNPEAPSIDVKVG